MEENSRIIVLMAKQADRSASPEELEELNGLLSGSPVHGYLLEVLGSLKGNSDHLEAFTPGSEIAMQGWSALSDRMGQERSGMSGGLVRFLRTRSGRVAAAAAVVLLVLGGWGMLRGWQGRVSAVKVVEERPLLVVQAGYGETKTLILSDGTKVWLNAGSRLSYPETFAAGRRDVELEGEAFFDVARNKKAPFSVHAGKIRIGVLGTSFDVKAYREESKIETTLISGKVQVTLDSEPERAILLSPHEKLTIPLDADGEEEVEPGGGTDSGKGKAPVRSYNALRYEVQRLPKQKGNDVEETAWLSDKVAFSDERFETVARQLERKYDVKIVFSEERLREERISGLFDHERIERVLQILSMTTPFRYRVEERTIYLSNK